MDNSRQIDLHELREARKTAPSQYFKDIDRSIRNIQKETPQISSMRKDMINANRCGDTRAVKNLQSQIDYKTREANGGKYGW